MATTASLLQIRRLVHVQTSMSDNMQTMAMTRKPTAGLRVCAYAYQNAGQVCQTTTCKRVAGLRVCMSEASMSDSM